jgi:hypothetical protein
LWLCSLCCWGLWRDKWLILVSIHLVGSWDRQRSSSDWSWRWWTWQRTEHGLTWLRHSHRHGLARQRHSSKHCLSHRYRLWHRHWLWHWHLRGHHWLWLCRRQVAPTVSVLLRHHDLILALHHLNRAHLPWLSSLRGSLSSLRSWPWEESHLSSSTSSSSTPAWCHLVDVCLLLLHFAVLSLATCLFDRESI